MKYQELQQERGESTQLRQRRVGDEKQGPRREKFPADGMRRPCSRFIYVVESPYLTNDALIASRSASMCAFTLQNELHVNLAPYVALNARGRALISAFLAQITSNVLSTNDGKHAAKRMHGCTLLCEQVAEGNLRTPASQNR